jgi:hypothetical protein
MPKPISTLRSKLAKNHGQHHPMAGAHGANPIDNVTSS